ncbi:MAG: 50S ribosomal protein L29 [Acidobacteria bacterium]|nr:50S ribosomal protein L29 [Acidobacteriota bacterium]
MKASKLRDMSRDDLLLEESTLRERLFRLRFQAATGQMENASKMRGVRRDIARIETILRETELAEAGKK